MFISSRWLVVVARALFVPTLVAQFPAFGGGEACRERSGQQRNGNPERELRGGTAGSVGRLLCLRDCLIDPLLGLGLRNSGTGCDQAGSVAAVVGRHLAPFERCWPDNPEKFRAGGGLVGRRAGWSGRRSAARPASNRST